MGNNIIKMKGCHTTDIKQLASILRREIKADLISESCQETGGTTVILLCFEKYYFRIGGYASLTIMLTEYETEQTADIVGSGGGTGVYNFNYGANANFSNAARKLLMEHGFQSNPPHYEA